MPSVPSAYVNPLRETLGAAFFRAIPKVPGVYLMRDSRGELLYVGKAKDLRARLRSYSRARPGQVPEHTLELIERISTIRWRRCRTEAEALLRESELLHAARPPYNIQGTESEHYLYIGVKPGGLARKGPGGLARAELRTGFLLSNTAQERGYRFCGCYPHRRRTKVGYTALLRLIHAAHTRRPRFSYPAAITRDWPPWSYEARLDPAWLPALEAFLDGRSPRFLRVLLEASLANDCIPRFMYPSLQQDFDLVAEFYRLGPRATRRLRLRSDVRERVLTHAEMDALVMDELLREPLEGGA